MKEINSSTEIHSFPDIYNKNNEELLSKINELTKKVNDLESSRQLFEDNLNKKFELLKASVINEIAAKYDLNRVLLTKTDDINEVKGYSSNTDILIPKLVD